VRVLLSHFAGLKLGLAVTYPASHHHLQNQVLASPRWLLREGDSVILEGLADSVAVGNTGTR